MVAVYAESNWHLFHVVLHRENQHDAKLDVFTRKVAFTNTATERNNIRPVYILFRGEPWNLIHVQFTSAKL
jgi:hypothetical protein